MILSRQHCNAGKTYLDGTILNGSIERCLGKCNKTVILICPLMPEYIGHPKEWSFFSLMNRNSSVVMLLLFYTIMET